MIPGDVMDKDGHESCHKSNFLMNMANSWFPNWKFMPFPSHNLPTNPQVVFEVHGVFGGKQGCVKKDC